MSSTTLNRLSKEIKSKSLTDQPFGVNFAIGQHGRLFREYVDIAIEEKVPVISVTGGNRLPFFNKLKRNDMVKLVLVASKRQALKAEELGADAVMVVGQEGGGHLGKDDIGTFVLIPQCGGCCFHPCYSLWRCWGRSWFNGSPQLRGRRSRDGDKIHRYKRVCPCLRQCINVP